MQPASSKVFHWVLSGLHRALGYWILRNPSRIVYRPLAVSHLAIFLEVDNKALLNRKKSTCPSVHRLTNKRSARARSQRLSSLLGMTHLRGLLRTRFRIGSSLAHINPRLRGIMDNLHQILNKSMTILLSGNLHNLTTLKRR